MAKKVLSPMCPFFILLRDLSLWFVGVCGGLIGYFSKRKRVKQRVNSMR